MTPTTSCFDEPDGGLRDTISFGNRALTHGTSHHKGQYLGGLSIGELGFCMALAFGHCFWMAAEKVALTAEPIPALREHVGGVHLGGALENMPWRRVAAGRIVARVAGQHPSADGATEAQFERHPVRPCVLASATLAGCHGEDTIAVQVTTSRPRPAGIWPTAPIYLRPEAFMQWTAKVDSPPTSSWHWDQCSTRGCAIWSEDELQSRALKIMARAKEQ